MDSHRHVDLPQTLDEDQTADDKRCFFFTRDVAKSERFIVDRIDTTIYNLIRNYFSKLVILVIISDTSSCVFNDHMNLSLQCPR